MSTDYNFGSAKELQSWAAEVVEQLPNPATLYLIGELGSGKTTFVQGLGQALGVADRITSPTFTVVAEYPLPTHSIFNTLVHVDLYRLEENIANDPALQEVLDKQDQLGRLTVIEWADRLAGKLQPNAWQLKFFSGKSIDNRRVTIER